MVYDYVILGGGISGIAFARLLQTAGVESFVVLEATDESGGLCRTKQVGSHFLDIGGGHFLCTKYPEVYNFIFAHIPKSEFNFFNRVSTIRIEGVEIDYPLESNIWQLAPKQQCEYIISVVRNGEARGLPSPQDFESWIRWKLGDLITDRYMIPYNSKIWGVAPNELDVDWLHKLPRLNVEEIVATCLTRQPDSAKMPSHAGFYYPKKGGFQALFDAIALRVRGHIVTRTPAETIERRGSELVVNGQFRGRRVVTTVPWHDLAQSPVFDHEARRAIAALRHNSLVVSLHEENYRTNAHWTYIPAIEVPHHREFFINNFAPYSSKLGVYRETNLKRWSAGRGEIFAHTNSHAYPIPTVGWSTAVKQVLSAAESQGIFGLGRWGQWEYFNSDVCVLEAMRLMERLGERCIFPAVD